MQLERHGGDTHAVYAGPGRGGGAAARQLAGLQDEEQEA